MTEKKPKDIMIPQNSGMLRDLVLRLKLIVRLMGDRRVSPFLKLLPVVSLLYLVYPLDLISVIPGVSALDDMAIVSLGAYLFLEFCPPEVVQEHMKKLTSNTDIIQGQDEVVEGEATDISGDEK